MCTHALQKVAHLSLMMMISLTFNFCLKPFMNFMTIEILRKVLLNNYLGYTNTHKLMFDLTKHALETIITVWELP